MILVDAYRQHDWLIRSVERRLREELARLHVVLNELKSRVVDLVKGDAFGFLGFELRRVVQLINAILRGWVTYFAVGHSARCFRYVKD